MSVRSTSVLTKKPMRSSSALSVRPAIGLPIGMSVPAPSRVSSAASPACSTMNRLAWPSRAKRQQTAMQLGANMQRHTAAAVAGDRRPGPVARQFDLIGKTLRVSVQNASWRAIALVGVALVAEQAVLPQRVVGILHRQGRQLRRTAPAACRIGRRQDRAHSGANDQPSPAMWCSTSNSTCSLSPSANRCARSGSSLARSKPRRAAFVRASARVSSVT